MGESSSFETRRPSARGRWLRVGFDVTLAGLAWWSWSRNGASVGVPVVVGLLIGAVRCYTRLEDRLTRHPVAALLISSVHAGAVFLCLTSCWGGERLPPGRLDVEALQWTVGMLVVLCAAAGWGALRERVRAKRDDQQGTKIHLGHER